MATSTTTKQEPLLGRVDEDEMQHGQLVDCFCQHLVDHHDDLAMEVSGKRGVSRLAVEGNQGVVVRSPAPPGEEDAPPALRDRRLSGFGGRTMPPPHAWLAIEDTTENRQQQQHESSDPEEQWLRLLRGGGGGGATSRLQQRRSSFNVVRRERAAREAWLDRAWEMKRSWHQRNGGAPDADTPVVVVVGNNGKDHHQSSSSSPASDHAAGVAMDVEEVRACRDLGLELPSDCTVEIQCFGLDGGSPTHTGNSSGADSPCSGGGVGGVSSHGADPVDVKARLKAWAQAVALTSTTQLGS